MVRQQAPESNLNDAKARRRVQMEDSTRDLGLDKPVSLFTARAPSHRRVGFDVRRDAGRADRSAVSADRHRARPKYHRARSETRTRAAPRKRKACRRTRPCTRAQRDAARDTRARNDGDLFGSGPRRCPSFRTAVDGAAPAPRRHRPSSSYGRAEAPAEPVLVAGAPTCLSRTSLRDGAAARSGTRCEPSWPGRVTITASEESSVRLGSRLVAKLSHKQPRSARRSGRLLRTRDACRADAGDAGGGRLSGERRVAHSKASFATAREKQEKTGVKCSAPTRARAALDCPSAFFVGHTVQNNRKKTATGC